MSELKDKFLTIFSWVFIVLIFIAGCCIFLVYLPARMLGRNRRESIETMNNSRVNHESKTQSTEQKWTEEAKEIDKERASQ